MKDIDIYNWKRKAHYDYYQTFDNPCFSLTVNIDITLLIEKLKKTNLKFFPTFLYCLIKAMNQVEEFKCRIRKDGVIIHETIHPSYTVLNEHECFVFCYSEFTTDFKMFYQNVLKDIEVSLHGNNLVDEEGKDDLVYISSIPWISFTGLTHPFKKDDPHSIPRVNFGRYFEENKIIKLPISVQAHHGLVDGLHIARMLEAIEKAILEL